MIEYLSLPTIIYPTLEFIYHICNHLIREYFFGLMVQLEATELL